MINPPLPQQILEVLQSLRPVFHACSWESFLYLITGLLLGQARAGIVRASLYAPKTYNWRRLHDLLRRSAWSGTGLMVALTKMVLSALYPDGFPTYLFWVIDSTYLEKMYARAIEGVLTHHRPHQKAGQSDTLKGHGVMLVAHLYQQSAHHFKAFLLGGLLYVKQKSFGQLSQQLFATLPLPAKVHNVALMDRGLTSLKLARALDKQNIYCLGRVKGNARLFLPAPDTAYKGRGRRPIYGDKFRADALPKGVMHKTEMSVPLDGKLVPAVVYRGTFRRKGFSHPIDLIRVEVKDLSPWLLMLTALSLSTEQAVLAYAGRSQIEVAINQAKALGLDTYRGRKLKGVQRWPMIIGVVHCLLQLIAVGALKLSLPAQNWPWYRKENTVGSIQRRFIQWVLRRLFSNLSRQEQNLKKIAYIA
jgi:hypothetical protein